MIWATAKAPIQHHNHVGNFRIGRILKAAATKNIKSVILSIVAPALLVAPIFLARGPSIISDMPHHPYSIQNAGLNTGVNRIPAAVIPRDRDIILGICALILPIPCLPGYDAR